jgi:hypothetical protein
VVFGRRFGRGAGLSSELLPSLLVRDPLALLDHEEVDEAGEGIPEERQVLLPVAGRVRQRPHAVERERERGTVTLPAREAEIREDLAAADP